MKVGRNDPCPCGSGKKLKKCCIDRPGKGAAPPDSAAMPLVGARARGGGQPAREGAGAASPAAPWLTPYTVARIAEDPRSLAAVPAHLRARVEQGIREAPWSIAKVANMSTEAIEEQLRRYGVRHDREELLRKARSRTSAWSLSTDWYSTEPLTCRGMEEDFLGLAACELWKRLIPEVPSLEMLDDWMQEGYALLEARKEAKACDVWWKTWRVLHGRFTPAMRDMGATLPVFNGTQSLFNWCQDFELSLGNAAIEDRARYAESGRQYCEEWLAQFTEEDGSVQVGFRRALAGFLLRLDDPSRAEELLLSIVKDFPDEIWGYVALGDAYSCIFPGLSLPCDMPRAIEWLHRGRAIATHARDRRLIDERLAELSKRSRTDGR